MKKEVLFQYKKWKSTKIHCHFITHKLLLKQIKSKSSESTRAKVIASIKQKGVWDTMSSMFNFKLKANGSCNYDDLDVNELNKYYKKIAFPENMEPYDTLDTKPNTIPNEENVFSVTNITISELKHGWKSMKKKNSCFPDNTGLCKKNVQYPDELSKFCRRFTGSSKRELRDWTNSGHTQNNQNSTDSKVSKCVQEPRIQTDRDFAYADDFIRKTVRATTN
jgi:hypothetical protein